MASMIGFPVAMEFQVVIKCVATRIDPADQYRILLEKNYPHNVEIKNVWLTKAQLFVRYDLTQHFSEVIRRYRNLISIINFRSSTDRWGIARERVRETDKFSGRRRGEIV